MSPSDRPAIVIPFRIATHAVEDNRGRVRHGRGVLDADVGLDTRNSRVVPAAVPFYDGELCVSRFASIPVHETGQIVPARVFIVDAQSRS